jgi:medium-chain acyl-[acyl-carrier-protein] hydrolase
MSMESLVAAVADEIWRDADRPFSLFGHSMGALVAFLVARRLRAVGGPAPRRLFVSARRAPHIPNPHPPIAHLPDDAFLAAVQRFGIVPAVLLADADLRAMILPPMRADFAANEAWRHTEEPPLELPIAAFGGDADGRASPEEMAPWRQHTAKTFVQRTWPGGHFYLSDILPSLLGALVAEGA